MFHNAPTRVRIYATTIICNLYTCASKLNIVQACLAKKRGKCGSTYFQAFSPMSGSAEGCAGRMQLCLGRLGLSASAGKIQDCIVCGKRWRACKRHAQPPPAHRRHTTTQPGVGSRKLGVGSRELGAGSWEPGAGTRVFVFAGTLEKSFKTTAKAGWPSSESPL